MLIAGLVAVPALAMLATAAAQQYCVQNFDTGTFHCFSRYETSSDALTLRVSCDQLPRTLCPADGHFDTGGLVYDGGRSPNHEINGGAPDRDLPVFFTAPSFFDEKVYIHDDVFGQNVGGFYCQDVDGDGLCGEGNATQGDGRSEPAVLFCGHVDLGPIDTNSFVWAGYYVVGPLFQGRDCPDGAITLDPAISGLPDPVGSIAIGTNPIGGTSGTLSIWLAPVPQPPPQEPDNHDGVEYGGWGGGSVE